MQIMMMKIFVCKGFFRYDAGKERPYGIFPTINEKSQ